MGRFFALFLLLPWTLGAARLGDPRLVGVPYHANGAQWYISAGGDVLTAPGPETPTVNLWQLAASRWLDAAGVLLLIFCLLALRAIWRLWRHRNRVGQIHCKTCDYDLRGCVSTRCPECGEDLIARPGVTGWPIGGRVAVRVVLMLLGIALWLPVWMIASPFREWNGPEYFSDDLYHWAQRKNVQWILDRVVQARTAERIDVATGATMCVLTRSAQPMLSWSPVRAMRDTRYVIVVFQKYVEIRQSDNGKLVHRAWLPDLNTRISDAWDTEAGVLCVMIEDGKTHRWRWRDGTRLPDVMRSKDESYGWFFADGERKLIKTRDGYLRVVDRLGGTVREFYTLPDKRYTAEWFSHDSQWIVRVASRVEPIPNTNGRGSVGSEVVSGKKAEIWDVPTGRKIREIDIGDRVDEIAMDSRRQLIFVTRSLPDTGPWAPRVEAYDTTTGEQVSQVFLNGAGSFSNLLVKTNGSTLVITSEPAGSNGLQVWEIPIVYDDDGHNRGPP